MSERLDLSNWLFKWTNDTHSRQEDNQVAILMNESLRAQASEDALTKRVQELEEERLILVDGYADNGELSHREIVKASTGELIGVISIDGAKESE